MSDGDRLNRTTKLFADDGSAESLDHAAEIHRNFVLQVVAGRVGRSLTRQAILATVLNTGARAFAGGVRVVITDDSTLELPWVAGLTVSEAVDALGTVAVGTLDEKYPTVVLGDTDIAISGSCILYPTWEGWAGGAVANTSQRLREEQECVPSGVLAGGLAVSEAFQHHYGHLPAGRRDVGISLWKPDRDWRDEDATGPALQFAPKSVWLAGLGHLGQAHAWALGCLPYASATDVDVMLQDFDTVVEANASTGALCVAADAGERKTRLVARRLESLGFVTAICERRYDAQTIRAADEPFVVLAGFDRPEPRRELDPVEHGFALSVDAGLGGGTDHYTDIAVHSFPGTLSARDAFSGSPEARSGAPTQPAYDEYTRSLVDQGVETGAAQCGAIDIAGRTVAVAFVGAVASALVLADPLRLLHGGDRYEIVDVSLRSPDFVDATQAPDVPGLAIPFLRL